MTHGRYSILLAVAGLAWLITPQADAQLIQTVAGNGATAYAGDGGPATASSLNNPFGVAVDNRGNLYIADDNNQRIRVVNTGSSPITVASVTILPGAIATVAGNGTAGFSGDGGPALNAQINNPSGIAVDGSGNIFIADLYNFRVRKVNSSGIMSTVTGIGTQVYSGDNGPAANAGLYPYAVAVDASGNLYVADTANDRIRAVNMSTNPITVANVTIQPSYIATVAGNGTAGGSGNGVPATQAQFDYPYGIAVDRNGSIFICDTYNRSIRVVNAGTSPITVAMVTIQPGNIATVAGDGSYGHIGDGGLALNAEFADPDAVAVDSAGNIYVSDLENERIRFINNSNGKTTTIAGVGGIYGYNGDNIPASTALLAYPRTMAVDGNNNIYIADQPNQRIREIVVNSGSFTSRSSTAFTTGTPATFFVTTNDTPTPVLTYSGTLPNGIVFIDKGNGRGTLSGTPAAGTAGTYNLTFTASNGVFPNAVQNFTLTVYLPGTAPVASSATFLTIDTGTQGAWQGVYGADGYSLANVANQVIPAYASFSVLNQDNYTWATNTADPRALRLPSSSGGIASTWFNAVSFGFDLNMGPSSHQFTIYALDWDGQGRSETIQILDMNTGAVLDTQTLSGFTTGVYLSWNITGHVQIIATVTGGLNSAVNGVFFGGAGGGSGGSGGPGAFLTSFALGQIRNNYGGWIGMKFTVGTNSLRVTSLGRICVPGDSETHSVEIVSVNTGSVVPGATVALNLSGCITGQFVYGSLPSPITLLGNASYYLVSQETFVGDQWYNSLPVTSTNDAFINSSIYSPDAASWFSVGGPNTSYGPSNFLYSVLPPEPITVTVQTNPPGLSINVDGTPYSSTQTFTWIAGTFHTITTTNPQSLGTNGQYVWSAWSDGGGVSHTVSPGSAVTYTATFTTQYLLSANVLPAGAGTIVANPSSATGYYNSGNQVQLTYTSNPVCTFMNWSGGLTGNSPTVTMSGPLAVTANFQCNGPPATSFLTGFNLNGPPLRDNFSGWVGMKLTVGANPLAVAMIGRLCAPGNSGSHLVKFISANTGVDVLGGSASLNMASCVTGQFIYASPSSPFTLQANTSYYLVSQEVNLGDQWYDFGALSTTGDGTVNSSIYSSDGVKWTPTNAANTSYVPHNFLYSVVQPVPIAVTVQTNSSGASFTVDGTTYTAPYVFNWTAGSSHTVSVTSSQSAGIGSQYLWSAWSDGGAISHTISPSAATTITANFTTQYLLSTNVMPVGAGGITANPASPSGYYNSGAQVQLTAAPSPVCIFLNWSGALSGNTSSQALTMSGPLTTTANFQCSGPASTNFLTGYALNGPGVRNNFGGWVGMKVTVGASPLSVSAVGRICVAGNSGTHSVKFVSASTGSDVPGGSASLNMSGCSAAQFLYASLASPITLQANTSYYVVSQEVNGGDQWYDYGTVSSTIVATVNNSIYSATGSNWSAVGAANTSYVPVDFQYSLAPADPTFVTGYNLNNRPLRNNFSGWVGMKFTVGASGMIVNSLGRIMVTGNSGTHTVKLVKSSDGTDVPGASASVSMAGGTPGQFSYTPLAGSITLQPNTSYYLVSQEVAGGDQWYDYGTLSTTSSGVVNSAVYSTDSNNWITIGSANMSYVPPNLK